MKTVAALLLIIGHCALTNGMPNAIKEVAEDAISQNVGKFVNSLGDKIPVPVTGPPKTELKQSGKSNEMPIGVGIQEEIRLADKIPVPVTGPPKTVLENDDEDLSSAVILEDVTGARYRDVEDKTCTCTCKTNRFPYGRNKYDDDDEPACTCTCNPNYQRKNRVYKDCKDAYSRGRRNSGVYTIRPYDRAFKAYCDMSSDGGGWTVFQRRKDGSVNFYRNWDEYVNGFGDLNGEFWLGLRYINELTAAAYTSSTLRVDLPYPYYAKYSSFSVGNSASKYTLSVSGYNGNVYDSLSYHNGMKFSTPDQDNDNWGSNCAQNYRGSFWYNSCYYSNLNGDYNSQLVWYPLGNIKFDEMKVRRN